MLIQILSNHKKQLPSYLNEGSCLTNNSSLPRDKLSSSQTYLLRHERGKMEANF